MKLIAEIGGNHHGEYGEARTLISLAKDAGATHVKFQCFSPEQMVGDPSYVLDNGPWKGRNLLDLYKETYTPRDWFKPLFDHARAEGIVPFASVFHKGDVDFLEDLDCEIYKIASSEAVDLELIRYARDTGKELIVSTGGCSKDELYNAWEICEEATFMRCVPSYPAVASEINLTAGPLFWKANNKRWGLSDHTLGCGVAAAAVALGAEAIEKHLTLDRRGPDAEFSMNPKEFRELAFACKQAKAATTGANHQEPSPYRRSLWWSRDLAPGEIVSRDDVKVARPADGLHPKELHNVIGSMIVKAVRAHTPIKDAGRHYE